MAANSDDRIDSIVLNDTETGGERRPPNCKWPLGLALGLGIFALVIHLWQRRWNSLEEVLIVCGWFGTGTALKNGSQKLAWKILALTCTLEMVRLLEFSGPFIFPPEDFAIVFESARLLYQEQQNPYLDPRANAFPFPAYPLFYLTGFAGHLKIALASQVYLGLNILALLISILCLSNLAQLKFNFRHRGVCYLLWAAILLHPGVAQALLFGQTGILVLLWVTLGIWSWQRGYGLPWFPALFFTLAWMQKPYLVMAALFFLVCLASEFRKLKQRSSFTSEATIGLGVIGFSCGIVLLLMILPGGIEFTTFQQFVVGLSSLQQVYSQSWADNYAFVAIVLHIGMSSIGLEYSQWIEAGSIAAILIILLINIYIHREMVPSLYTYLPWLVASLLPFAVVWKHYYPWIIPVLYLLLVNSWQRNDHSMFPVALCVSIGMLHVLSSPVFTAGLLSLFLVTHWYACTNRVSIRT